MENITYKANNLGVVVPMNRIGGRHTWMELNLLARAMTMIQEMGKITEHNCLEIMWFDHMGKLVLYNGEHVVLEYELPVMATVSKLAETLGKMIGEFTEALEEEWEEEN